MVLNLVENAIKYSTGGVRQVSVSTGSHQNGSDMTGWVRISDTGPGIPAEHLPHLFDRFYRVDKARTRQSSEPNSNDEDENEPGGSGLGLSIVQWIANAHHGQVKVESNLGSGTTFEVDLPLLKSERTPA